MEPHQQPQAPTAGGSPTPQHGGAQNRRFLGLVLAPFVVLLGLSAGMRLLSSLPDADADLLSSDTRGPNRRSLFQRPPPSLKPAPPEVQKAVERTIQGQLDAMARGDYASALFYALPDFRRSQTPERFRDMIASGYPVMAETKTVEFRTARVQNSTSAQIDVVITGKSGRQVGYHYWLVRPQEDWAVISVVPGAPITDRERRTSTRASTVP